MDNIYKCKTSVLIIAFNRPDYLEQTFARVRDVRPPELFLAVDGARLNHDGECERVKECQKFAERVDWPCNVHTLFRKKNIGCGYGPAEAITWAFKTTDRLIILEDDCVAEPSFFRFCDEMLGRYAQDERVWLLSGRGHHPEYPFFKDYDYIFSHYGHTWGWATWKRCWDQYDIKMSDFKEWFSLGGAINTMSSKTEANFYNQWYKKKYDRIEEEVKHSWDAQWAYTFQKVGGLAIVPAKNQIHNIGVMGTHSSSPSSLLDLPSAPLRFPLRHPKYVFAIQDYETYHFKRHILKLETSFLKRLIDLIVSRIKRILHISRGINNK